MPLELITRTFWGYRCLRCEHVWEPRGLVVKVPGEKPEESNDPPRICPSCKSPYFDKERTRPEPPNKKKRAPITTKAPAPTKAKRR